MKVSKRQPVRVLQIVDTLASQDGIGNIILNLQNKLTEAGIEAITFAVLDKTRANTRLNSEEVKIRLLDYHSQGFLFVYHYGSVSHELDSVLIPLAESLIIYYHNITPPFYWRYWSGEAYKRCLQGEKNLAKFLSAGSLLTGASWYNISVAKSFPETRIIPPILPPTLARSSGNTTKALSREARLIFLGRFTPNKRQDLIIAAAYALKKQEIAFHLTLVGNAADRYGVYVRFLIWIFGLREYVEIRSNLDDTQMGKLYEESDFFVAATEHEGYCMPVADAMEYDVIPILRPIPVFQDFFAGTEILAPSLSEADFVSHVTRVVTAFGAQPSRRKELLSSMKKSVGQARKKYLTAQKFASALARGSMPRHELVWHEDPPQSSSDKASRLPWRYLIMDMIRRRVIQTLVFFLLSAVYLRLKRTLTR